MPTIPNPGLHFAILSHYSYKTERLFIPKAEELGYTAITFIDREGTQCYFMESDDKIVLVFRGTEITKSSDIVTDLKFCKSKSKTKGGVHDGFYDEVNRIFDDVSAYINDPVRRYKKVWTCGHSLGGALAALVASRLPTRIAACYTYGCPRVGDKSWAKSQRFIHHRYVNNNDIVPTLPPMILCYRHFGAQHYINYYGNIRDLTAWQRTKDQIRGHLRAWSKFECFNSIRDHNIKEYIRKLK